MHLYMYNTRQYVIKFCIYMLHNTKIPFQRIYNSFYKNIYLGKQPKFLSTMGHKSKLENIQSIDMNTACDENKQTMAIYNIDSYKDNVEQKMSGI